MSLVSIIIPCYNQGEYLEECLESVARQTYTNIEVIIVNDGSTDIITKQKLIDLKEKYLEYVFLDIPNSGVSVARNTGIQASRGEYILPLDGDDKISRNYVERCLDIFNSKNVDIVYSIGEFFGDKAGVWYLIPYSRKRIKYENMVFCSAMFKRKDFFECGGYNENMKEGLEDWDFWISMTEKEKIFYRIDEIHFYYRIKKVSRNTGMLDEEKNERTIFQMQKNHPKIYGYNISKVQNKRNLVTRIINKVVYEFYKFKLKKIIKQSTL